LKKSLPPVPKAGLPVIIDLKIRNPLKKCIFKFKTQSAKREKD
jgi:hypothetical protein